MPSGVAQLNEQALGNEVVPAITNPPIECLLREVGRSGVPRTDSLGPSVYGCPQLRGRHHLGYQPGGLGRRSVPDGPPHYEFLRSACSDELWEPVKRTRSREQAYRWLRKPHARMRRSKPNVTGKGQFQPPSHGDSIERRNCNRPRLLNERKDPRACQ